MGLTEKIFGAFAAMIKLEGRVKNQSEAIKSLQTRIEDLTGRVIRLEAQLDRLMAAASMERLQR